MLAQDYCWLSGEQLSDLVMAENFQWIWADLCAFDKGIALAEVLQYELPRADGYDGFWQMPLTMRIRMPKSRLSRGTFDDAALTAEKIS